MSEKSTLKNKVTIVGNGAWGTAVALVLASKDIPVTIWGHDTAYLQQCAETRRNPKYLEGIELPTSFAFEADLPAAIDGTELIVSAMPTRHIASVFEPLAGMAELNAPIVSLSKGIDRETLRFPSQTLHDLLGSEKVLPLSGPSMAEEIALGKPASLTVAHPDQELAVEIQHLLSTESFRVYASSDIIGVELGGALKNVIAIAAGIIDGMELGDNAKAALLARGLAEISRLGRELGAQNETFSGLAGIGDLYTTCASPHGRNRGYGERLGRGMTHEEAVEASAGKVVEGVDTAKSIHSLAKERGVEMPICEAVYRVIYESLPPADALNELLTRSLKNEVED